MKRSQHRLAAAHERCCAALYEVAETGLEVTRAAISWHAGLDSEELSAGLSRLRQREMVTGDKVLGFTECGWHVARTLVRRRRLAECLLADVLGLSWAAMGPLLDGWMVAMTPELEVGIARALGRPLHCPHGNPIPGTDYIPPAAVSLRDVPVGRSFEIVRVFEPPARSVHVAAALQDASVAPGRRGTVVRSSPDGSLTLSIDERTHVIDDGAGRLVHVLAA